jgi:hypothetical protein
LQWRKKLIKNPFFAYSDTHIIYTEREKTHSRRKAKGERVGVSGRVRDKGKGEVRERERIRKGVIRYLSCESIEAEASKLHQMNNSANFSALAHPFIILEFKKAQIY